jgi:hypothetical protein
VLSVRGYGRPVILVLILGVAMFGSPWNWSCSVSGLLAKEFLFSILRTRLAPSRPSRLIFLSRRRISAQNFSLARCTEGAALIWVFAGLPPVFSFQRAASFPALPLFSAQVFVARSRAPSHLRFSVCHLILLLDFASLLHA